MFKGLFSLMTRHWISLVGSVVAVIAGLLIVMLFAMQLSGFHGGPYLGILTYLLLPMVFVFGLVLVPVGVVRRHKLDALAAAHHEAPPRLPIIDLNDQHTRGVVFASVVVGLVASVILAGATYKGVNVMESVTFCGAVCHTVMQPEYTAFKRGPHSHLRCADCHIGSGADWFVKSKISGSWQLVSVAFHLYPRPIPDPVHSLRPARETCEECHWPTRHIGDQLVVKTNFAEDENNTETKTVLLMKVGGQEGAETTGIHWHVSRDVQIRYLSDPSRQKIFDIEVTTDGNKVKTFKTEAKPIGPTQWRTMDCIDCHNRPAHMFKTASEEINDALSVGTIDKSLPYIKREGLRLLNVKYPSQDEARTAIAKEVEAFYKTSYPDLVASKADAIAAAGKALGNIYGWNVFPKMNVTWGTYRSNIGHEEAPGCRRCHDRKHVAADGTKIPTNCNLCHTVLAEDEQNPAILKDLGGN
jgi:NapC/NirT cytochrome c family, N-terminal region